MSISLACYKFFKRDVYFSIKRVIKNDALGFQSQFVLFCLYRRLWFVLCNCSTDKPKPGRKRCLPTRTSESRDNRETSSSVGTR